LKLDYVHDIQSAFRTVTRAFSFPGSCHSLAREAAGIDDDLGLAPSFLLVALMLLDSEVRFAVVDEQGVKHEQLISRLTYSRAVGIPEADYIFIPGSATDALPTFLAARGGNLVNPEQGATIILGADSFNLDAGKSHLSLSGPGIKTQTRMSVARHPSWIQARTEKNREFPLGVDILLLSADGQLAALPRTTRITVAVGGV